MNVLRSLRRGTHKPRVPNRHENPNRVAKYDLRHILQATRDFLATDPRDKIYGVWGMTHEDSRQHIPPMSESENEKPKIVDVFRDATKVLLLNERTTKAYIYFPMGSRIRFKESFPSWIPNFAVLSERIPLKLPVVGHLQNWRTLQQHQAEDIEFVDDENKLRIYGFELDTIKYITKAPPTIPWTNPLHTISQIITTWLNCFLRKYYKTPSPTVLTPFVNLVGKARMRSQVIEFCHALVDIGKWPVW